MGAAPERFSEPVVELLPTAPAIRQLASEGIRVNTTLIFSPTQALMAAKAGAAFVSPFVGRLDDVSHTGMESVEQIVQSHVRSGSQGQFTLWRKPALAGRALVSRCESLGHIDQRGGVVS